MNLGSRRWLALLLAGCVWGPGGALAHGGGLNAEGCHHNRKTGDYHCHGARQAPAIGDGATIAPVVGGGRSAQVGGATSAAPGQLGRGGSIGPRQPGTAVPVAPAASRNGPTCHVGPRGGTYTITASGRKNYGAC